MPSQPALLLQSKQGPFALGTINVPEPAPGELLVKIEASALNPVDWKVAVLGVVVDAFPAVLGSDIAGTVAALGPGTRGFAIGDRVACQGQFRNASNGFQQYAVADAELTAKIPRAVPLDAAASLPLALNTAALGLYTAPFARGGAGLTPPWAGGRGKYAGRPLVVFGGSTSVGQYVLQLARLSGFAPVLATASPRNAPLLTALGATHVLDRALPADALRARIAALARAPVATVYDAVASGDTQRTAHAVLAPGGVLVVVQADAVPADERTDAKTVVHVHGVIHAPLYRAWGVRFVGALPGLLEEQAIVPNRVEVVPGGLAGVEGGLDRLRRNEVSAHKLVVRPQETETAMPSQGRASWCIHA